MLFCSGSSKVLCLSGGLHWNKTNNAKGPSVHSHIGQNNEMNVVVVVVLVVLVVILLFSALVARDLRSPAVPVASLD